MVDWERHARDWPYWALAASVILAGFFHHPVTWVLVGATGVAAVKRMYLD